MRGLELLEKRPLDPLPQGGCALPTPRKIRIPCLIFTPRGVEQQLKIFCDVFFAAAAPSLHHLVPPHLTIPCFHSPPKHNVAVPINKVEGWLGGTNLLGAGSGLPTTPRGGSGRGSVRMGASLEMKGGGAHEAPRYHCKKLVL